LLAEQGECGVRSGFATAALATALGLVFFLSQGLPVSGSSDVLFQERFESGLPGWAVTGGNLTTTSDFAHTGDTSAMLTVDANAVVQPPRIAIRPQASYLFNAFFLNNDSRVSSVRLHVEWQDSHGAGLGSWNAQSAEKGPDWNSLTLEKDSPANAAYVVVQIIVSSQEGGTLYLDDVSVEGPGSLPPTLTPAASDTPLSTSTPATTGTPPRTPSPTPSGVPSPTPPAAIAPSLTNGGFEDANDGVPSGWQKYGGDLFQTSTERRSGQYSGELISSTDSTKWAYEEIAVSGDNAYQFDIYVLLNDPAVQEVFLRVSWYTSDDTSGSAIAVSDSPQRLTGIDPAFRYLTTGPVLAPPAARSARFRVMLAPASSAPARIYIDDASLQMVSSEQAALPIPPPPGEQVAVEGDQPPDKSSSRAARSPAATAPAGLPVQGQSPYPLKINEVVYDPPQPDAGNEWLELYNAGDGAIDLAGWTVSDNGGANELPSLVLGPRRFAVIAGDGFRQTYPDFNGAVLTVASGRIGNGLANTGDRLLLYDPSGKLADALSWGDDTSVLSPSVPLVASGHSIERSPAGRDSDAASDLVDNPNPSPGRAFGEKAVAAASVERQAVSSSTLSAPQVIEPQTSSNLRERVLVSLAAAIVSLAVALSFGLYGHRRLAHWP
jgi:Lamin Tail Domain